MVKVTMEQVLNFRNNGDFLSSKVIPLKIAYKLNKLKKAVETEAEFYGEKFQEIIDTYAKKDENGNIVFSEDGDQIMIAEGKIEDCNKALDDLQNLEVEIDNCNLTIDDFGDNMECTAEELEALMPFLG